MKKFIINLVLLGFLVQLPNLVDIFLSDIFLTFRTDESINARYTAIYGTSYPNKNLNRTEIGGLAVGTPNIVIRDSVITITDKLGYRNTKFINNPDVVVMGDSQAFGSGSNQNEIFAEQIMQNTNLKVYSVAPADPINLQQLINDSLIRKPKIIIWEKVEREIPGYEYDMNIKTGFFGKALKFLALDNTSQYILEKLSKYSKNRLTNYTRSMISGRAKFPTSIKNDSIYFYEAKKAEFKPTESELNKIVENYVKVNEYFKKQGIILAFMPFPNKETVLYDHVPFNKQPDFLNRFCKKLKENNVLVIDCLPSLTESAKNGKIPYLNDDTHYGKIGMKLVSNQMIEFLNKNIKK